MNNQLRYPTTFGPAEVPCLLRGYLYLPWNHTLLVMATHEMSSRIFPCTRHSRILSRQRGESRGCKDTPLSAGKNPFLPAGRPRRILGERYGNHESRPCSRRRLPPPFPGNGAAAQRFLRQPPEELPFPRLHPFAAFSEEN